MHLPLNCAVPGNIPAHPKWKVTGSIKVMEVMNFKPKKTSIAGEWIFSGKQQGKKIAPIPEEIIINGHEI